MRKFFLFFSVLLFFSFTGTSLKKRISDKLYRYEFFTTDATVIAKSAREYFWFKGGVIHNSEYGTAGELLHDNFVKFYHSNQLAEAGKFNRGLKTGYWKKWYEDGTLQSKVYWDEGQMDGSFYVYGLKGNLIEEGSFKNNKKHGRWINYVNKDTIRYKHGLQVIKKVKDTLDKNKKAGLFVRLFSKKDKIAKEKTSLQPDVEKEKRKSFFRRLVSSKEKKDGNSSIKHPKPVKSKEKVQEKAVKEMNEDGFFKRLFSKKDKKQNHG